MLVFGPLRVSNSKCYPQLIYSQIRATRPTGDRQIYAVKLHINCSQKAAILDPRMANRALAELK